MRLRLASRFPWPCPHHVHVQSTRYSAHPHYRFLTYARCTVSGCVRAMIKRVPCMFVQGKCRVFCELSVCSLLLCTSGDGCVRALGGRSNAVAGKSAMRKFLVIRGSRVPLNLIVHRKECSFTDALLSLQQCCRFFCVISQMLCPLESNRDSCVCSSVCAVLKHDLSRHACPCTIFCLYETLLSYVRAILAVARISALISCPSFRWNPRLESFFSSFCFFLFFVFSS